MILVAVTAGLLSPTTGRSQDVLWSPDATETCLQSVGDDSTDARDCIGASAERCIDTPDGYTTVGMTICAGQEAEYWDARLNDAYRKLKAIEEEMDAEIAEIGTAAPPMAPALRDMQRSWISYRDATCEYEASQFGSGTGSGPASAACVMQLTGEQALYLEQKLAEKTAQ